MNAVTFYAIRIKGTDLYKSSGESFATFDEAILSGVYYNQLKTAEKNLKQYQEMYTGGTRRYPNATRWLVNKDNPDNIPGGSWAYYTCSKAYYDQASTSYAINFVEEFELEIVELQMTLK